MVVPLILGAALIGTVAGGYAGSKKGGGSSAPVQGPAPAPTPAPAPAPVQYVGPNNPSPGYMSIVGGGDAASGGAKSMLPILVVSTVATVGVIMLLRRK